MARPALDHQSIRFLLDVNLSAVDLPASVISSSVFAGEAWRRALARDPLADSYADGSAEQEAVKRAVEYLTAAELALGWTVMSEESFAGGDYRYRTQAFDGAARAALLRSQAEAQFVAYLDEAVSFFLPGGFAVVHGCRGR